MKGRFFHANTSDLFEFYGQQKNVRFFFCSVYIYIWYVRLMHWADAGSESKQPCQQRHDSDRLLHRYGIYIQYSMLSFWKKTLTVPQVRSFANIWWQFIYFGDYCNMANIIIRLNCFHKELVKCLIITHSPRGVCLLVTSSMSLLDPLYLRRLFKPRLHLSHE